MDSHCDKVQLFVDGELPEEQADEFRLHLADCVKCQREMTYLRQMDFLAEGLLLQEAEKKRVPAPRLPAFKRWMVPSMGVGALLAAAVVLLVVIKPFTPSLQHDVWLAQRRGRLLEARVSYPEADRYRELAPRNMGGGDAAEDLPYEDLSTLTKRGDAHGVVAAYLVRDDEKLADWALKKLEDMERSPDLESDRAVALLVNEKPEEALRVLEAVLAQNPRHPQALWNRGLVLRELNLPMLAAQSFMQVAALNEPGWSAEARKNAEALLSKTKDRSTTWEEVAKDGKALLKSVPGHLSEGFGQLSNARRLFYQAVRGAESREQVLALLPVARMLDERAGGDLLEQYVNRVAKADFSRRAPLSRNYVALSERRLSAEEKERFLATLLQSQEDDILLGVLPEMGVTARHLELYEAKATASGDPWFPLLAALERARAEAAAGNRERAVKTLKDAKGLCPKKGLEYRCISLDRELADLYMEDHQLDLAHAHAKDGWEDARAAGEWGLESSLLFHLGQIARASGDMSLSRAYLGEFLARDSGEKPVWTRLAHQELAVMAMQELRVDEARREIDAALATGNPLGIPGVFALAEISRLKSDPKDEESLTGAVNAIKPGLSAGDRVIATHVLGRFFIERDEQRGRNLLWQAIQEAEAPELAEDRAARRARAYSFTSLLMAEGRKGNFQEAMKLLKQERGGMELPSTCLLVATADSERTLLMALGKDGALRSHYEDKRRQPLPRRLERVVPEELLAPLRECEKVEVLARPPLHGRGGLLPPELAWSYLTRTSAPRATRVGPATHLVVFDVELPKDVALKQLNTWTASFGSEERPVRLSGAEATPSRVLSAMKNATEIDLVAHGIRNDATDTSYVLLADERGGPELDVSEVRAAELQGAPFVVLAACHAAHATYAVDAPLSLPAAFIEAGARGVLAATVEIPDKEAEAFFNAVRERMRSGASPALALRDERMQWLREGKGKSWLDSVLLFE